MRKLLFLILAVPTLTVSLISNVVLSEDTKPMVYAVMMHADWCGTCKALAPKITQSRETNDLDSKNLLFLRFDLTNETTSHQAAMMAAALGITELYKSNAGKTGFMVLIDAKTGEKIGQITNKLDTDGITERFNKVLAAQST